MKSELEAKFLDVGKDEIRSKLRAVGAECVSPERLMRRVVFESKHLTDVGGWLRVRDEGDKIFLTLKQTSLDSGIHRIKEAQVRVDDFDQMILILKNIGMVQKRYQENYRESWKLKGVSIEIDTWPQIPSYVEIEANTEADVISVSNLLGFDYRKAVFGSADEVYKNSYNIDILSMDILVFDR